MEFLAYKYDGTPIILNSNKSYDFEYTETAPPEGIYAPFEFDGNSWIGTKKEEESVNDYEPNEIEKVSANLQMQLVKANITLIQYKKEIDELLQEKESSLKNLEQQQAQMMLEITKLKGGN